MNILMAELFAQKERLLRAQRELEEAKEEGYEYKIKTAENEVFKAAIVVDLIEEERTRQAKSNLGG